MTNEERKAVTIEPDSALSPKSGTGVHRENLQKVIEATAATRDGIAAPLSLSSEVKHTDGPDDSRATT